MPIMVAIPDNCKSLAEAVERLVASMDWAAQRSAGGRAVDYAQVEREIGARTAEIERAAHERLLAALDVDAPAVLIDGQLHTRVHRVEGRYYTLAGDVVVLRSLYRARRNGTVVDAISLRTGALDGGWLPETAAAMAQLLQQGPSREAETTAQRVGRLPYSRCSFERVGHAVGRAYAARHVDIADALIEGLTIPAAACTVSFGIDRVSLPVEEPRARPVGRPRKHAARRPVQRVYRMAYCATVTLHDAQGEALQTIRYGAVPSADPADLCDRLFADATAILAQRPELQVVLLADGAPELRDLLRSAVGEGPLGVPVTEILDFWHLAEKLAPAAQVVYGAAQAPQVRGRWRATLLNRTDAPDEIREALLASGQRQVQVGDHQPVHEAITYLENHRDRMGYPSARRRGLPIGSGVTEASCKSLFVVRMKRNGARWKEQTAGEVIHLRALALSDRWDAALRLTFAPLRKAVRVAA